MHTLDHPDFEGYEARIEWLEIDALVARNKGQLELADNLTAEAANIKTTLNLYRAKYPQKGNQ